MDITGQKAWKRAKERKHNELINIAKKYHLHKENYPLYMGSNEVYFSNYSFEQDAKNYADNKYANSVYVRGWFDVVIKPVLIVTLSIAVSAVIAYFSVGLGTEFAISIAASAISSITATAIQTNKDNQTLRDVIKASRLEYQKTSYDYKEQALERSAELTSLIVYGKYEMYAGGNLYKEGQAGSSLESNSYNPAQAYDPTRGMRGDLKQKDVEFDKSITYKNHTALAGNKNYMQQTLKAPFPITTLGFDFDRDSELTQKGMDRRLSEINNGFGALLDAEAGITGVRNDKVESTSNPAQAYKRILDYEMEGFFKQKLKNNDRLQKSQRYAQGLWADFDYISFRVKSASKQNNYRNQMDFLRAWESDESKAYRDTLSDEGLLKYVFSHILFNAQYIIESLQDYTESIICEHTYAFRMPVGGITISGYGYGETKTHYKRAAVGEEILERFIHLRDVKTLGDLKQRAWDFSEFVASRQFAQSFSGESGDLPSNAHLSKYPFKQKVLRHYSSVQQRLRLGIYIDLSGTYPHRTIKDIFGITLADMGDFEREFFNTLSIRLWDKRLDSMEYASRSLAEMGFSIGEMYL